MALEYILLLFFLLTFAGVPIAFSIAAVSCIYIVLADLPLLVVGQRMVAGADSFPLLAAPLFMLAGIVMSSGGIMPRLLRLSDALVGHITGGLAQVNVIASLFMAGMSGSATADASGQGSVMIPAMKKSGYSAGLSAAVTAASSVIGPIFPPSVPFVIYGALAQVSIGHLFIGAMLPGIVMTVCLMAATWLICRRAGYRTRERFSGRELLDSIRGSALDLCLPLIVIGGILGGIFTPIEAAAVAAVYALLVEVVIFRDIPVKRLPGILLEAARLTGMIMFVIAVSNLFGWILVREGAGRLLVDFFLSISSDPYVLRVLLVVMLLILGFFIETIVLIILMIPILASLVPHLGMDPIHLGVTVVLVIMIGLITPPVGLCMFIVNAIAGISVAEYTRAIMPFFIALVISALLVALVPPITTWLPSVLMP